MCRDFDLHFSMCCRVEVRICCLQAIAMVLACIGKQLHSALDSTVPGIGFDCIVLLGQQSGQIKLQENY